MEGAIHWLWTVSWQALVLALLVLMVTSFARRAPAAWRHALWLLVRVKFVIPPFVYIPSSMVVFRPEARYANVSQTRPSPTVGAIQNAIPAVPVGQQPEMLPSAESAPVKLPDATTLLATAWILGVSVMLVRMLRTHMRLAAIVRASVPTDDDIRLLLVECASRLRLRRVPSLRGSQRLLPSTCVHACFREQYRHFRRCASTGS